MNTETLTREGIATALNRNVGLNGRASRRIVDGIITALCDAVARGEGVKISGFGSFVIRDKAERIGRNPKTGVEALIVPRRVLTFRASRMMRDQIIGREDT